MKNDNCLCGSSRILIFSCSGGSNVGQLANQAAVDLTKNGTGRLVCLAGIGAHHSGMVESAKGGDLLVAIDGCQVRCAAKTLEHAGLKSEVGVVITDMGIEKSHQLSFKEEDCRLVAEKLGDVITSYVRSHPDLVQDDSEGAGAVESD